MSNPKNPSWYGGGLGSTLRPGANLGNVFYVDGNGPDTNNGLTPQTPLASIKAALALCVSQRNDMIVVLDYWAAATEDWPIVVDKEMVSIVGAGYAGSLWPQVNPPGDTAAFNMTAQGSRICNLAVHGGATHGAIEIGAAVWGIEIDNCWFGVTGAAQDGVRDVAPFDAVYLKVTNCRFGVELTRDGVRILHNATRGSIGTPQGGGNLFDRIPGIAINVVAAVQELGIYNNVIAIPANTAGAGITLSATTANCIVSGNVANFGDTTMGNNPFADGAGAGVNNWGLNYQGITAVMPS